MPNPEQLIAAAKIGAEIVESNATKLPGLIELSGRVLPGTISMVKPEVRVLMETAGQQIGNSMPSAVIAAAERSGVPLGVDPRRIAAVREALIGGNSTAIDASLSNAFTPRTYVEKMAFYGG